MISNFDQTSANQLSLTVNAKLLPLFFQLLGHGFRVDVQSGCTVKELLCNQLGIHEDYLSQRIKTIFLDAKVVDDVNTAIVGNEATIALSGAMPGLVGAILRSGGFYAPMRRQISHEKDTPSSQFADGKITLKLWNMVVKELGPTFLERGIWIQTEECKSFIERHSDALKAGCPSAELDEKSATMDHLQNITWKSDRVFLQVTPT